jgi:hypothetical protein
VLPLPKAVLTERNRFHTGMGHPFVESSVDLRLSTAATLREFLLRNAAEGCRSSIQNREVRFAAGLVNEQLRAEVVAVMESVMAAAAQEAHSPADPPRQIEPAIGATRVGLPELPGRLSRRCLRSPASP